MLALWSLLAAESPTAVRGAAAALTRLLSLEEARRVLPVLAAVDARMNGEGGGGAEPARSLLAEALETYSAQKIRVRPPEVQTHFP